MQSQNSLEKQVDLDLTSTATTLDVDVAAKLTAGTNIEVEREEAARIRRKIDLHILPLMCIVFLLQFADKNALGQSAILGLFSATHISQYQYNLLGTVFSVFLLFFAYPQNWALQKLPVGKWVSINILIWGITLVCHSAAKNFGTLVVCRIFLAICEGVVTPGFMIVTSMFYTREEQTLRVAYWYLMDGFALIILGLISFGTLHIDTPHFMPWQWLNVIFGAITIVVAVLYWLFFPDSPTDAYFLTPEERVKAVLRIRVNQSGVENKHFKKEQFMECIRDPKTWMWFFYAAFSQISNALSNQRQLIISEFGFSPLQTTLIGCVDGVVAIIAIWVSGLVATSWKNGRAYSGALSYCVAILGGILVITLSFELKVGLLMGYWLCAAGSFPPYVLMLAWVGGSTAGHTKRVTTNAIVMIGYALGGAVAPLPWKQRYRPRNEVPWIVLIICWAVSAALMLLIRWYLARENARRDGEQHDSTYDDVYIIEETEDGKTVQRKVDKAFLDLTDIRNRDFRYPL